MRFTFIDSRISDIPNIISSFESDVNYYVFDYYNTEFADLKDKLIQDYDSIGIIQHNTYSNVYKLLEKQNDSVIENVIENDSELQTWADYIDFLKYIRDNNNVTFIDLFACDLWSNNNWKYIIQFIKDQYNIHIRASINITGDGGDFILESENFDTIGVYFTDNILQYKYAFSFQTYTAFGPYGIRYFEPYVLPDSNPGKITTKFATSTAITFPTVTGEISNVKFVVSNGNAAVVRLTTGNAIVLGTSINGGNPSQTIKGILNTSSNVVKIVCNDTAFCAIYVPSGQTRKQVIHWGYYGATDIETIGTGNANFNNISTVQSLLDLVDISDVAINSTGAFVALNTSGVVYTWGDKATGGDPANSTNTAGSAGTPSLATLLSGTNATFGVCEKLICGQKHFGVISSNLHGVVWGNKTSATSGGFIYNTSVTGVDDILLATDNLQNCIFLRIPESLSPFSVSVNNINTSGTVGTQSLFTGLSAKPRYLIQRIGIGRATALITNTLSEYLWVYLDDGMKLITFGVTTSGSFQTLTNNSTGLNYSNVSFFSATPSVITFKTNSGLNTFATQVDANVTNSFANMKDVEEVLSLTIQPSLYYTFETSTKSGSTITNLGSNGTTHNLTLYNGADITSSIVKYGSSSINLSGTSYSQVTNANAPTTANFQYARTNNTLTITSGSSFAVSFWFYMSGRGTGYPMIFNANNAFPNRIYVGLNPSGTNKLLIGCGGTPGLSQESFGGTISTTDIALNTWHYFGWTVSGGTWLLRVNGGTSTLTGRTVPTATSFPFTCFNVEMDSANVTRQFSGYIDNFRFFNGSLTATDLTNLYNEPQNSSGGVGFLKYNLNRQLKFKPSSNVVTVYGSGTSGTTALTETYTNATDMYTSANTYAVSQSTPSQYTLVEAIINVNQKTIFSKTANTGVYFGPSGKGLYALEIPFNPSLNPSELTVNTLHTLSYYVSNPDLAAERWSKYALSTSNTSVVQVGSQYTTYENISNTYVFADVSFSTLGNKTLYIWSVVPDLCYNILSFDISVNQLVPYPCFLQGSKILRLDPESDEEHYVPVEKLRRGDLIKTSMDGYKAISFIGKATLENPANDPDPKNRLYVFKKRDIKGMTDDLCITGEHCTLRLDITESHLERIREHMGNVYITDDRFRCPACLDERAVPYSSKGPATIWHFALEHDDAYWNYGVYANGLLVESCSIEHLVNRSKMMLV